LDNILLARSNELASSAVLLKNNCKALLKIPANQLMMMAL